MNFKEYFISCYPNEGVGYIKNGIFFPIENTAELKATCCEFDGSVLIEEPDVIIHSHCHNGLSNEDHRVPSYEDMQNQLLTATEWAICVTDGLTCTDPVYWGNPNHRPPLIEREFIPNIQDCLSLVQDWYYETWGIVIPNHPREPEWALTGHTYMDDLYKDFGFTTEVAWEDMRFGDVLMMKCLSATSNHVAVYLGDGNIIHHGAGQISVIEPAHRWKKRLTRIVRHREAK